MKILHGMETIAGRGWVFSGPDNRCVSDRIPAETRLLQPRSAGRDRLALDDGAERMTAGGDSWKARELLGGDVQESNWAAMSLEKLVVQNVRFRSNNSSRPSEKSKPTKGLLPQVQSSARGRDLQQNPRVTAVPRSPALQQSAFPPFDILDGPREGPTRSASSSPATQRTFSARSPRKNWSWDLSDEILTADISSRRPRPRPRCDLDIRRSTPADILIARWATSRPRRRLPSRHPPRRANEIHRHGQATPESKSAACSSATSITTTRAPTSHRRLHSRRRRRQYAAQVTFKAETWQKIQASWIAIIPTARIVGWYHTHPGFGIFLSGMDLFIQDNFLQSPLAGRLCLRPRQRPTKACSSGTKARRRRGEYLVDETLTAEEAAHAESDRKLKPQKPVDAAPNFAQRLKNFSGRTNLRLRLVFFWSVFSSPPR